MRWNEVLKNWHRQESSQDLLENALVLGTVVVAVVAGSETVATVIGNSMVKIGGKITSIVQ
jgi:Flp pilus assembly pilin Flp